MEGRFDPAAAEMSWRERSAYFRGDASKRRVEGFESHVAATKAQVCLGSLGWAKPMKLRISLQPWNEARPTNKYDILKKHLSKIVWFTI